MNFKFKILKDYLLWFIIWISFFFWTIYASSNISWLFEKVSWQWKIDWLNIKEDSITFSQLWTNSITTSKILDKNVTESKLSDFVVTKLNSPIVTEIDPTAVKLTWNEIISWIKTFTTPVIWVNPVSNNDYTTKSYVDSIVSSLRYVNWTCWDDNWLSFTTVPTNLCNTWNPSIVTTNSTNYTWTCNWIWWWTNSSCSANRANLCPSWWVLVWTKCQSALRWPSTYLNWLNDCSSLASTMVSYDSNFRACWINSSDICLSGYLLQWVYSTNTDYWLRYIGGYGWWWNANISNYSTSWIIWMFQDDLDAWWWWRDGTHYYRCIK